MGTPGPTYVDEEGGTRGQREALLAQKATKLFFFKKFFDNECMDRIVGETNIYVTTMPMRPRPATLRPNYNWPPRWTDRWEPVTEPIIWRFIALLLWMGMHKTQN